MSTGSNDDGSMRLLEEINERLKRIEPIAEALRERDVMRHKLESARLLSDPGDAGRVFGSVVEQAMRIWDSNMTEDEAHALVDSIVLFCDTMAADLDCSVRVFAPGELRGTRGWTVQTQVRPYNWAVQTHGKPYTVLWGNPVMWKYMRDQWLEICQAFCQAHGGE